MDSMDDAAPVYDREALIGAAQSGDASMVEAQCKALPSVDLQRGEDQELTSALNDAAQTGDALKVEALSKALHDHGARDASALIRTAQSDDASTVATKEEVAQVSESINAR